MSFVFDGYCPIFEKEIPEGLCVEIIHELSELKKEEHILHIKKYVRKGFSTDEIYKICLKCPNSPPEWKE